MVSIIVPVYKVEEYLPACVDSILAQSHKNIEVILVNDGSPDRCGEICDDYGARDSRVTVIHKENGGLSDARNAGMAVAKGEWLMFVDSDDILPANAVEALLDIAQSAAAELVIGGHRRFSDVPEAVEVTKDYIVMSSEEAMADMFRNGCAAWARIYRREIHKDIHYPVGEINEDEAIVLRILDRCKRVAKTDAVVYHYRFREESITTTDFHVKKLHWVKHCVANAEYIREHYPALLPLALTRYRGSILWALREFAFTGNQFRQERKAFLRELRKEPQFQKLPFTNEGQKVSFLILRWLPFWAYRVFLRVRHG